jgi:hypothetical protein
LISDETRDQIFTFCDETLLGGDSEAFAAPIAQTFSNPFLFCVDSTLFYDVLSDTLNRRGSFLGFLKSRTFKHFFKLRSL